MAEIPQYSITRSARMVSIPAAHAGRRAVGAGKIMLGKDADEAKLEAQLKTAAQLFKVMGTLKGGAMKLGQIMSVFESSLPEELTGPYRESLSKLQDSAPPMSTQSVLKQMKKNLGEDWRSRFQEFDETPAAAASIGQVHKAIWKDGREVAVKIQYPGAAGALIADLNQISRLARFIGLTIPGLDVKALVTELKERVIEELDYIHESRAQKQFANAYEGHPDFFVPHVLSAAPEVMITEWVDSRPLLEVINSGTQEERNKYGQILLRFLLSGPSVAGLLHCDPHPGNFRIMADGRMVVLDFGATAAFPDGLPGTMGSLLNIAMVGDDAGVVEGLRNAGFIKPNIELDPRSLLNYLAPFTEPTAVPVFKHSRQWLQELFAKTADPRNPDWSVAFKINLPPEYLMIHRTWMGSLGVLCQLEAEFSASDEFSKWVPGFEMKESVTLQN
jgi:predicted unusual protein kinase regulating ubiquinone biosynthesis (AarF/ABC1/UbiB family)